MSTNWFFALNNVRREAVVTPLRSLHLGLTRTLKAVSPPKLSLGGTICFVLAIFCFCGCDQGRKKVVAGDFITISATNPKLETNNDIHLSEFVDKIEVIPLEFNTSCMLREINKIVIHDDNIFIYEGPKPKTIYRFNINGDFLNQIGSHGPGPDDILELRGFSVDEETNTVYLFDNARQTVFNFSFDGKLIEKINVNQYGQRFEYKDGLFYFFIDQPVKGELYSVVIRDKKGNLENVFFPSNQYDKNFGGEQPFIKSENGMFFSRYFNDTIYSIKGKELNYAYFIDFGPYRLTARETEDFYTDKVSPMAFGVLDRLIGEKYFHQVSDFIFFKSTNKFIQYTFVYNLKTKELKNSTSVTDDLEYMFQGISFYGQKGDALIGIYDASSYSADIERIKKYREEGLITEEKANEQIKKFESFKRGDDKRDEINPWVLLYHIKKQ
ncbi:MAG: 6-bladed beta-propeller [Prevotellaceae bacterium]|nr:6-bladed beta-propeller [Prevotellaceae bacterium]